MPPIREIRILAILMSIPYLPINVGNAKINLVATINIKKQKARCWRRASQPILIEIAVLLSNACTFYPSTIFL